MKSRDFLKSLPSDQKELGARVFDKAELALKKYGPVFTDFLDPGQQAFCKKIVSPLNKLSFEFFGGYEDAERKRMVIFPGNLEEVDILAGICFLGITGNFRFQKVSHRDFLGGVLGAGVKREKLGDILVTDTGCQLIAAREIKEFLLQNIAQIHQVPVQVNEITSDHLEESFRQLKEISSTVSSLRLDSVAGVGCGISRSQAAKYISGEKVKLNWEIKTNGDCPVQEGDLISVRGFGRMKLQQVRGATKKGRIGITIIRYL